VTTASALTALAAMAFLVIALALLLAHLIVVLVRERDRAEQTMLAREEEWRDERRELLTRVVRPDLVPIKRTPEAREPRERQTDAAALAAVGRVSPRAVGPDDDSAEQEG
jgi:hypothetical protein